MTNNKKRRHNRRPNLKRAITAITALGVTYCLNVNVNVNLNINDNHNTYEHNTYNTYYDNSKTTKLKTNDSDTTIVHF